MKMDAAIVFLLLALSLSSMATAQTAAPSPHQFALQSSNLNVAQTARVIGLEGKLQQLMTLRARRSADAPSTIEELSLRQDLLESIQTSLLDVDSVLAELANEQSELNSLRAELQSRRDRKVAHLTNAALLTGSGLGTAASATQFSSLGTTTQNVGDAIGVGSGIATTILSILAGRAQNGPRGTVEATPNMLAPLLGGTPVLNSSYPPEVLAYLNTPPAGQDPSQGTRLQQLMAEWNRTGRLPAADSPERTQKIQALTSSGDRSVKVSIDELKDRIAMLGDVRGRVALLQRDLASLMHSYVAHGERW